MAKEHSELVRRHFEEEYYKYDELIRKMIPKYEELQQLVVDSLIFPKMAKIRVLDLGVGTGETALRILDRFPNAQLDGHDIAKNMIRRAKARTKKYLGRIKFFERDVSKTKFSGKYDACISILCVHHLDSKQKKELFSKIFNSLKKRGIFVMADIVKFDSKKETRAKEFEWKHFLVKNFGNKEGTFWFENYKEEDLPDSASNQLIWLRKAGFAEVGCLLKYMNCAVIYGKKL